ncbi:MAG: glycine--tRNA ligase subunit beta [Vampirovibrionales bacterium]
MMNPIMPSSSLERPHLCLFEVGTEELPAGFLQQVVSQWQTTLCTEAQTLQVKLTPEDCTFYITPRRLAVHLTLPASTETQEVIYKGPSVKVAFDAQGQPTPALLGFCKKWGITPDVLEQVEEKGHLHLQYRHHVPAQTIHEVLSTLLTRSMEALTGSHFMKWEEAGELRFSRPIRWLVCLLDTDIVPFTWAGLTTDRMTYGHRILAPQPCISLKHARDYVQALQQQGAVTVEASVRSAKIFHQVQDAVTRLGGAVYSGDWDDLSETLVYLSETPEVVVGTFEEKFQHLPSPVLNTVLKSHQKCLLVRTHDAPYAPAMPYFLTVANGVKNEEARHLIAEGNAKVVRSRFADALFFYQEDLSKPLAAHAESLHSVVFQRGLGTLADKTERLLTMCGTLEAHQLVPSASMQTLTQSIPLLKADLVTHMVFEFPELQGEVGEAYALAQGLETLTAQSILDHYLPRFPGDLMPRTFAGHVLGILDRLDTLLAVFSQPKFKVPTGSRDPLGLRRLVAGLLHLLQWHQVETFSPSEQALVGAWQTVSLDTLLETFYQALPFANKRAWEQVKPELVSFYEARLQSWVETLHETSSSLHALPYVNLAQEGPDTGVALLHPYALRAYVYALSEQTSVWQAHPQLDLLRDAMTRTENILQKESFRRVSWEVHLTALDPHRFESPSEHALYEALRDAYASPSSWQGMCEALLKLAPLIHQLFDEVMIFAEDTTIAQNRVTLLKLVRQLARQVAGRSYWAWLGQQSAVFTPLPQNVSV